MKDPRLVAEVEAHPYALLFATVSGAHLNANILDCNAALGARRLPWVDDLVARKVAGGEQKTLSDGDLGFYHQEYVRLREHLEGEATRSALPDAPTSRDAMADLLRRIRLR